MAIFGKDTKDGQGASAPEPRSSGGNASGGEQSLSVIAAGMRLTGDIDTEGVVKIEGKVEGRVNAARQVLVGRMGEVTGDINTREAVIGGRVKGAINASERMEAQSGCSIVGDITTKSIAVVEGAKINGTVRIADSVPAAAPTGKPAPRAAEPAVTEKTPARAAEPAGAK
jgi:cytoskeletal protein CcmA (bactofilin family)